MNRLLMIACAGAALAVATPAFAMTDAECTALWGRADANKDGILTDAEGARYLASLRVANKPIVDGKVTQALFIEHCKADLFVPAKLETGAPLPGANSFTEAQAKDRVIALGLSNVSALKKDADGVWRGTASDGSRNVDVAVDYKGHVVAR